jgi:hypothetical protein
MGKQVGPGPDGVRTASGARASFRSYVIDSEAGLTRVRMQNTPDGRRTDDLGVDLGVHDSDRSVHRRACTPF